MTNTVEMHSHEPPIGEVPQVVEHLFRHEAGKMVATLTRIFGIEHLALAEDVVQEALARALQTWPFYGVQKILPHGSCGRREIWRWTWSGAKEFSAIRKLKSF